MKRNKVINAILLIFTIAVISLNAFDILSSDSLKTLSNFNNISVEAIDSNHAKIHSKSIKTTASDFLFSKSKIDDKYQYSLTDLHNNDYYKFSSDVDIQFDDGLSNNPAMCVAVWGAVAAPSAVGIAGAAVTTATAAFQAAPIAGTIIASGTTAAANGIGFLTGAAFASGALVAAAPVAIIGGGLLGLASVG